MSQSSLDDALRRFDTALAALEAAASRRAALEAKRGDIDTELAVMQDDRARLAVELDGALTRMERLETAADDVDRRVARAMDEIRALLAHAEIDA